MNHQRRRLTVAGLLALSGAGHANATSSLSVADLLEQEPTLSKLTQLLRETELLPQLQAAGPFTLFAPTDAVWQAIPAKVMASLTKHKPRVAALLSYHLLPVELLSTAMVSGTLTTLQGARITLSINPGKIMVDEATLIRTDVVASNGVIHWIDGVLVPPTGG